MEIITIVISIVGAIFGSAGVWTLIDHSRQRKYDREERRDETREIVGTILQRVDELDNKIDTNNTKLNQKMDERQARERRIRILRFSDEIRLRQKHSEEHFNLIIDDIDGYLLFCGINPEFQNSKTEHAI